MSEKLFKNNSTYRYPEDEHSYAKPAEMDPERQKENIKDTKVIDSKNALFKDDLGSWQVKDFIDFDYLLALDRL
ncbi:hypothetical protein HHI36_020725 [Cryptolaemus montrouzieri]|uniref:Uncharacterized protein n=1 Tax=Cryptolaemus montrouzieri TaxID=559131 RepID=A0ABD2NBM5_9CUCU